MPILRSLRQVDLCEFKACLVYRVSSRTASAVTQRNTVFKNKQTKKPHQNQYTSSANNELIPNLGNPIIYEVEPEKCSSSQEFIICEAANTPLEGKNDGTTEHILLGTLLKS